jgi:hypothetical protein
MRPSGVLGDLGDPLPPAHGRAIGVGEAHVISMGEEPLHKLGIPFHELAYRQLILLDQLVNFIYRTHPDLLSLAIRRAGGC